MGGWPPRHARRGLTSIFHGAYLHEAADVLDNVFPHLVDVGIDVCLKQAVCLIVTSLLNHMRSFHTRKPAHSGPLVT